MVAAFDKNPVKCLISLEGWCEVPRSKSEEGFYIVFPTKKRGLAGMRAYRGWCQYWNQSYVRKVMHNVGSHLS